MKKRRIRRKPEKITSKLLFALFVSSRFALTLLGEQSAGFSNELHLPLQNLKLAGELNEQSPEQACPRAGLVVPVHFGNPFEIKVISEAEEPPVHRRHLFDFEMMS